MLMPSRWPLRIRAYSSTVTILHLLLLAPVTMYQHTEGHWRGGPILDEDFCLPGGPELDEDYHRCGHVLPQCPSIVRENEAGRNQEDRFRDCPVGTEGLGH